MLQPVCFLCRFHLSLVDVNVDVINSTKETIKEFYASINRLENPAFVA